MTAWGSAGTREVRAIMLLATAAAAEVVMSECGLGAEWKYRLIN